MGALWRLIDVADQLDSRPTIPVQRGRCQTSHATGADEQRPATVNAAAAQGGQCCPNRAASRQHGHGVEYQKQPQCQPRLIDIAAIERDRDGQQEQKPAGGADGRGFSAETSQAVNLVQTAQPVRQQPARRPPAVSFSGGSSTTTSAPQRAAVGGTATATAPRPARTGGDDAQVKTVRRDEPKIGRNDPCWCGSGKKYKKCHGA